MAMDEKAFNFAIALALEKQAPRGYTVQVEQHGQARLGHTSPDLVVRMPYGLRTIVETEYDAPAIGDAKTRLGYEFIDYMLPMKSVLAVGIPRHLGDLGFADLDRELMSDNPQFLMQVVTGRSENDPDIQITPSQPVPVSVRDLAQYAWLAAVPEAYAATVIDEVVSRLKTAQNELSQRLRLSTQLTQDRLLDRYGNHDSISGMDGVAGNVVGTLASMIQLHINLERWGNLDYARNIADPELWQAIEPNFAIPSYIAREWRKIEAVDYMPLSTIAAGMLEDSGLGPHTESTLWLIHNAIARYLRAGIGVTTNVAAEIWQSLIPDRDQRAAYYTKPAVAELLANLTTARLAKPAKARYNEVCAGTGTLARATEENIRFRHYAATLDKASIHAQRIEGYIHLTDINPQSVSVATANMTSLEPETTYSTNAIFAITSEGGSLNYLSPNGLSDLEKSLIGRDGNRSDMLVLDRHSAEICNNNDPYFVARKGAKNPIPRQKMTYYKSRADRRMKGVANGNAGLASYMHVIEHELLAYGGIHGKVLPLKAAHSQTYSGLRRNIENAYRDVIAICTAAGDGASMSADTGVQEMLVVATKQPRSKKSVSETDGDRSVTCVNLTRTFVSKLEAKMFADAIRREVALGNDRGRIIVGDAVGTYYKMTNLGEGTPWSALGSSGDYTNLTEVVTAGAAWDPATGGITIFSLPMTTLGNLVSKGPTHHYIGISSESEGTHPTGAFLLHPSGKTGQNDIQTNPSMWNVDAKNQVRVTCSPTHYGEPRSTAAEAREMLQSAGHFHISRGLRMSAQKIAVAYTEDACMGGRSWNTFKGEDGVVKAVTLFLKSTYGILIRVGYGQSSDLGRSPIHVEAIDGHPIPDFARRGNAGRRARRIAVENFERLRTLPLERISLSALDPNRAEIDRVATLMLGLDWNPETENMLDSWRRLMCLQPGVNANNDEVLATLAKAGVRG